MSRFRPRNARFARAFGPAFVVLSFALAFASAPARAQTDPLQNGAAVRAAIGLRPNSDAEEEGLDQVDHGEAGYHLEDAGRMAAALIGAVGSSPFAGAQRKAAGVRQTNDGADS